jgi:hypothetical protein
LFFASRRRSCRRKPPPLLLSPFSPLLLSLVEEDVLEPLVARLSQGFVSKLGFDVFFVRVGLDLA